MKGLIINWEVCLLMMGLFLFVFFWGKVLNFKVLNRKKLEIVSSE